MTFPERVVVVTIAVIFGSVFIEGVLAAVTPYLVVIFVMAIVGRLVWAYTGGRW